MKRRDFLKTATALAVAVGVPITALAKTEEPKKEVKIDVLPPQAEHLTTGFPTLDAAMGGGFRRGELHAFIGSRNFVSTVMQERIEKLWKTTKLPETLV